MQLMVKQAFYMLNWFYRYTFLDLSEQHFCVKIKTNHVITIENDKTSNTSESFTSLCYCKQGIDTFDMKKESSIEYFAYNVN